MAPLIGDAIRLHGSKINIKASAYGSPVHHIGIYIGGGQYVHAPRTGDVVKVASIYRFNGTPIAVRI